MQVIKDVRFGAVPVMLAVCCYLVACERQPDSADIERIRVVGEWMERSQELAPATDLALAWAVQLQRAEAIELPVDVKPLNDWLYQFPATSAREVAVDEVCAREFQGMSTLNERPPCSSELLQVLRNAEPMLDEFRQFRLQSAFPAPDELAAALMVQGPPTSQFVLSELEDARLATLYGVRQWNRLARVEWILLSRGVADGDLTLQDEIDSVMSLVQLGMVSMRTHDHGCGDVCRQKYEDGAAVASMDDSVSWRSGLGLAERGEALADAALRHMSRLLFQRAYTEADMIHLATRINALWWPQSDGLPATDDGLVYYLDVLVAHQLACEATSRPGWWFVDQDDPMQVRRHIWSEILSDPVLQAELRRFLEDEPLLRRHACGAPLQLATLLSRRGDLSVKDLLPLLQALAASFQDVVRSNDPLGHEDVYNEVSRTVLALRDAFWTDSSVEALVRILQLLVEVRRLQVADGSVAEAQCQEIMNEASTLDPLTGEPWDWAILDGKLVVRSVLLGDSLLPQLDMAFVGMFGPSPMPVLNLPLDLPTLSDRFAPRAIEPTPVDTSP